MARTYKGKVLPWNSEADLPVGHFRLMGYYQEVQEGRFGDIFRGMMRWEEDKKMRRLVGVA